MVDIGWIRARYKEYMLMSGSSVRDEIERSFALEIPALLDELEMLRAENKLMGGQLKFDQKENRKLRQFKAEAMKQSRRLLNKVNVVTGFHRHGTGVRVDQLDELSNRQLEFEAWYEKWSKADGGGDE